MLLQKHVRICLEIFTAALMACSSLWFVLLTILAQIKHPFSLHPIFANKLQRLNPAKSPRHFMSESFCKRDFTDVRDVVRAYGLLIQNGKSGETYNIGSGHAISIQELLDIILSLSATEILVSTDPARLRPSDIPIIEADISKLQETICWHPEISLKQTLFETLNYWREKQT